MNGAEWSEVWAERSEVKWADWSEQSEESETIKWECMFTWEMIGRRSDVLLDTAWVNLINLMKKKADGGISGGIYAQPERMRKYIEVAYDVWYTERDWQWSTVINSRTAEIDMIDSSTGVDQRETRKRYQV
jgi:hypothetical protein